jgi:autotransporter-associated beta strand protein
MKTPRTPQVRAALVAFTLGLMATSLPAANRFWSPSNGSGAGGDGTWDNLGSNTSWSGAANGTAPFYSWNSSVPDVAYFGGTAGTVTINSTAEDIVQAAKVNFTSAGYTLNGGTLSLHDRTSTSSNPIVFEVAATGGDTTINTKIDLLVNPNVSGERYIFKNNTTGTITFNGDIHLNMLSPVTNSRTIDIEQAVAGGKMIFNGTFNESSGDGLLTLRFGENGGVNDSTFELNGNNIDGLDGGVRIYRGTILVGHENALGGAAGKVLRIGGRASADGNTAAVLTNGAMTIVNDITVGDSGSVLANYVVGGATADNSTFSGGIKTHNGMILTLRAAAGGTVTFSGRIEHSTNAMSKDGAGTVVLSNTANTGNGTFTVKAGTLLVTNATGSAHGTGDLVVQSGATLGGTGRINPVTNTDSAPAKLTIQSGGTLLGGLGDSATGTLTIHGNVDFLSDSVIKLVLGPDNAHSSIARSQSTSTWNFQADQLFTFDILGGASDGTYTGILTGIATGTDVSGWRISPNSGVSGYFQMNGTNVDPEPGTALLLGMGICAILLRRRYSRPTA